MRFKPLRLLIPLIHFPSHRPSWTVFHRAFMHLFVLSSERARASSIDHYLIMC